LENREERKGERGNYNRRHSLIPIFESCSWIRTIRGQFIS
jgi:hypothetical protein